MQYIFSLHFVSPPPSPPAPSTLQPPDNPKPSRPREGILISDGSNEVHIVIDLPDTPYFRPDGDLIEDPKKNPEMGGAPA